jgi:hypothetical protein
MNATHAIVLLTTLSIFASAARAADDAQLFNDYLKYSQEVAAKHHLIVRAHFDGEQSKAKAIEFRYDRYPELERVQLPDGASYVRKKGASWIKSDDWGETGKPAPRTATKDFDNWIGLVDAPLKNVSESRDTSQGAVKPTLVENGEDAKPDEIRFMMMREHPTGFNYPRFSFTKFQDHALLRFFGGTMHYGEEKVIASIGYEFMFLVKMDVVTPTPAAAGATESTSDDANKLLTAAMKKMERGSWEVDETLVGAKTIHLHGLLARKDFDLTSESNDNSPPVRQITIVTLSWVSRDGGKTWQKTDAKDRSLYDRAHTAMMSESLPLFETVGTEQHEGETWQHLRMKTEEKIPDESRWHYWIAVDAKGEPLAIRQFQGAGIVRGELMSTKGTYRPTKAMFVKPPVF